MRLRSRWAPPAWLWTPFMDTRSLIAFSPRVEVGTSRVVLVQAMLNYENLPSKAWRACSNAPLPSCGEDRGLVPSKSCRKMLFLTVLCWNVRYVWGDRNGLEVGSATATSRPSIAHAGRCSSSALIQTRPG